MQTVMKIIILLGLLIWSVIPSYGAFKYHRAVAIDHTKCGSSDSTNFPVLFVISDATLATVANGGHVQNTVTQSGGHPVTMPADLIATSDSAGVNKIPWEVLSYDPVHGIIWFYGKVATLSHTADTLPYIFYGDPTVTTQQNTGSYSPANVWPASYSFVYHMTDNAASTVVIDSTSNANNGAAAQNTSAITASGQIVNGLTFNGSSDEITMSTTASANTQTLSMWIYDSFANAYQAFAGGGAIVYFNGSASNILWGTSTNMSTGGVATNTWTKVDLVRNGDAVQLYVNGVAQGSATGAGTGSYGWTSIGGNGSNFWSGRMNEYRAATTNLSADWITAAYNNESSPSTFLTLGPEISTSGPIRHRVTQQ